MPADKYTITKRSNTDFATVNPYFQYGQSLSNFNELQTIRNIVSECIQIHGYNVTVIRRDHQKFDRIWIEDPNSEFVRSFTIEMMIVDGDVDSPNALMTKFGIQMDQDITLAVSYDRWSSLWRAQTDPNSKDVLVPQQPNEGDLLVINTGNKKSRGWDIDNADDFTPMVYEIMFVDGNAYKLNGTQWYLITAKQFDYSGERITVGENEFAYEQSYISKWDPDGDKTLNAIIDKTVFGEDGNVQEPTDNLQPTDNVQTDNWFARNRDIEIVGTDLVVDEQFQKGKAVKDNVEVPNTVDGDTLIDLENW